MRTIEATTLIAEDRKLVLQLPSDVRPGEHRVVVVLDELALEEDLSVETPVRWDNGVLVYAGEVVAPIENAIDDSREQRIQHLMKQALQ
jgi:hypothetical protein